MSTDPTAYPKVYFSLINRVAPLIIHNAEQEAGLNPKEWTTIPPTWPKADELPVYPKIFYNVNVPPVTVRSAEEEAALGPDWRELKTVDTTTSLNMAG
jgi:hypothetical protein